MSDLTVHCYLWCEGQRAYRPEHVNTLARMVRRHLHVPHRFVCVTDETTGFDAGVELVPLPQSARGLSKLRTPEGAGFPSSYRRLWSFSPEAAQALGEYALLLDVDCIITGDITPLVTRTEDFVGYRPQHMWGRGWDRIAGGTWLLRTGTRTHLWEALIHDPAGTIARARALGYRGSDQAILSWQLQGCTVWPVDCGIYQSQDMRKPLRYARMPGKAAAPARIVHFNGHTKPWSLRHIRWIAEHYQ